MLKSLKDLIGGSEKKQKRAGTTLDLSYTGDETVQPEPTPAAPPPEESAPEKPVSALQAWLQQHDSGAFNGDASEAPKDTAVAAPPPEPEPVEEQPAIAKLSNPQLLRRAGEEEEDLSLRNNPVAKLRYGNKAAPSEPREEPENLMDRGESSRGSVRQFRTPPPPSEPEPSSGEAARTPRKSLLEQLEEFERASQAQEEVPEDVAPKPSASPKVEPAPEVAEAQTPAQAREEIEITEAQVKPSEPDLDEEVASLAKAEAEASDEDDEEFLMMRARKGRGARVSLLEALADPSETSSPVAEAAASSSAVEEDEVADSTVDDDAAATVEPVVSALSAPEAAVPEPELAEVPLAEAAAVESALTEAAGAAVLSIREAGVRLDEEEVRAVIEIAVSAAMPTIVEEVSRCVMLALESRYADKAAQNGHHPQD
jgi:hypothetical protein